MGVAFSPVHGLNSAIAAIRLQHTRSHLWRYCWRRHFASAHRSSANSGGAKDDRSAGGHLQHLGPLSETTVNSDSWMHRALYNGVRFRMRYYLSPVSGNRHTKPHAIFVLLAPFGQGYAEVEGLGRCLEAAGHRVLLPLWPSHGSPGCSSKDERVFSYSAMENAMLLRHLLQSRSLRALPSRPLLVVASGQACWPAVALAALSPELLAGAVLVSPGSPDPLPSRSALWLLADLTAGLWSHAMLWPIAAAAITLSMPFINWPPLIGPQRLRLRAYHLMGLRHRESDNGRALARSIRCTTMHIAALAAERSQLLPVLPDEPVKWSDNPQQLLMLSNRLAVTGWPHPAGSFGPSVRFANFLTRLAVHCGRSAGSTAAAAANSLASINQSAFAAAAASASAATAAASASTANSKFTSTNIKRTSSSAA